MYSWSRSIRISEVLLYIMYEGSVLNVLTVIHAGLSACASLDSRPIKIRPGTYCRGDSAHAFQITQNMGNRTTNVKP